MTEGVLVFWLILRVELMKNTRVSEPRFSSPISFTLSVSVIHARMGEGGERGEGGKTRQE